MTSNHMEPRFQFPPYMKRVTGGNGGEVILILGPEKTALYDAGMACFATEMIDKVKKEIAGADRIIDYVFASHSHYDHIGGVPYIIREWPLVQICGSKKAARVFQSEGAKRTIKRMGEYAKDAYGKPGVDILTGELRIDVILEEGDRVGLGLDEKGKEWYMEAIETLGHTDCSMSYSLEPEGILFTSESTGVFVSEDHIEVTALKGHDKTIEAAEKLSKRNFNELVSPHYGFVPEQIKDKYFRLYIKEAESEYTFIQRLIDEGYLDEEILSFHEGRYWYPERQEEQPYEAYRINAESTLKFMRNAKKL